MGGQFNVSDIDMPFGMFNSLDGRRQQIMYERGDTAGIGGGATVVRRRNGEPQTVSYKASVPLAANVYDYDIVFMTATSTCCAAVASLPWLSSALRLRPASCATSTRRHI